MTQLNSARTIQTPLPKSWRFSGRSFTPKSQRLSYLGRVVLTLSLWLLAIDGMLLYYLLEVV